MGVQKAAKLPTLAPTFEFVNLRVDKVVTQPIPMKDPATGNLSEPTPASSVPKLPKAATDALQRRLTDALAPRSHAVEMTIDDAEAHGFFQVACNAIAAKDDKTFLNAANSFTATLAKAQVSTSATPGVLTLIKGHIGHKNQRFLAAVKADLVDGFTQTSLSDAAQIEYVDRLFLTPAQKLYKIGMLVEINESAPGPDGMHSPADYRAFLFDHLLTATETRKAASYFYIGLLGFGLHKSARKLTQDFFELTTAFIEAQLIPKEEQWELKEQLRADLRSSTGLVHVRAFGELHLPEPLQRPYLAYMAAKEFPKGAVPKDTDYVKSRLRRLRRIEFDSEVKILSPADGDADLVRIVEQGVEETTVVIRGRVRSRD